MMGTYLTQICHPAIWFKLLQLALMLGFHDSSWGCVGPCDLVMLSQLSPVFTLYSLQLGGIQSALPGGGKLVQYPGSLLAYMSQKVAICFWRLMDWHVSPAVTVYVD